MISKTGSCKKFKGDRPCEYYWIDRKHDCWDNNSPYYEEYSHRILLIKLDALGDVVRSTVLAEGIKKKYPNCELIWLTMENASLFVESNPFVDKVLKYNDENVRILQCQKFDIIINLDKDPKATSMITSFNSSDKRGYGLSAEGHPFPLNRGTKYHYDICLDNWGAKQRNTKTYQEMIFESSELEYDNEKMIVNLDEVRYEDFKNNFCTKNNIVEGDNIILLNTGCGPVFPHKKWTYNGYKELIGDLLTDSNNKIILAGATAEIKRNSRLRNEYESANLIDTTDRYSIEEFCFLVKLSKVVVTGDTMALHLAIAFEKDIITFYGPTPYQETDLLGLGKKFVRKELDCLSCHDQFPCPYDGKCMTLIKAESVFNQIKKMLYLTI